MRYGRRIDSLRGFSWQRGIRRFVGLGPSPSRLGIDPTDLPAGSPYTLGPPRPVGGRRSLLRLPIGQTFHRRYGNVNPFPITYAFRPRLRGRLTLSGLTLLRKPWVYGEQGFHLLYRYSFQHRLFPSLQHVSRRAFAARECSPTDPSEEESRSFGTGLESRELSAQVHLTGELLRFL